MPSGNCLDLWGLYPELLLAGLGILLVPIAGFGRGRWRMIPGVLFGIGLLVAMALTMRMLPWQDMAIFCGTYAVDGLAKGFKLILEVGAFITLMLIFPYLRGQNQLAHAPVALLFATLGAMGLASSQDLGLIVLFLQVMSLASYLLVALVRSDMSSNEATLKYFIYAAAALAIMAYGLTFLYGLSGSLDLRLIGRALQGANRVWVGVAAGTVLIGYAFEATLVPFHFWAPDVYQGTTAPVAGFLSVIPKIAGFAGLMRFLVLALPGTWLLWSLGIAILAAITMSLGNLVALRQTRLKRLLAYSSIAQAGYVLMAVAVVDRLPRALSAASYYLVAYLFMNLGAFVVVTQLERAIGNDEISALSGLGRRVPGPALVLALSLLSLAGIPPLAGFVAKVLVFQVVLDGGLVWLAVIAIANMVIGLYYYIAIIAQMYLKEPTWDLSLPGGLDYSIGAGLSLLGTFTLGILPSVILPLAELMSGIVR